MERTRERGPWFQREAPFSASLCLECARSDRSARAFTVLVFRGLRGEGWWGRRRLLRTVRDRLRASDLAGWSKDRELSVILPETPPFGADTLGRDLLHLLRAASAPGATVSRYIYPDDWHRPGEEHPPRSEQRGVDRPAPELRPFPLWKRTMDLLIAAPLLLLLGPVLLAVALMVRASSPGPALYWHARTGHHGRPFQMAKFRSMREGASGQAHEDYLEALISGRTPAGPTGFKLHQDVRITPLGRFLRRWSIDELPQLWNVVRGEMSLVGPRPDPLYAARTNQRWHRRRTLEARPGITGPWQVRARSQVAYAEMIRLDLRYSHNLRPLTDLRLLAATLRAVVSARGAS